MTQLKDLINDTRSLSLAGMCKNAGKTTVLNALIHDLNREEIKMGLTSIGRDGESSDLVTGTAKPGIYVREGTLIATARDLLSYGDVGKEILCLTGMQTPMGEVVILRARSDGYIQLAGPSTNLQLTEISRLLTEFGAEKVLIDGAISRKSLCSPDVAETVILCSGASYDRNMDLVVRDTAFVEEILTLPQLEMPVFGSGRYRLYKRDGELIPTKPDESLSDLLGNSSYEEGEIVIMEGAVTDALCSPLVMSNVRLKNRVLVAEDSSKILLTPDCYQKLRLRGAAFMVQKKTCLLAVTVNPFSAYGSHFDQALFYDKMKEQIHCPVYDVIGGIR